VTRFRIGDRAPRHALRTIRSERVLVPDPEHLIHLQFRRYAACPVCNLHVRSIARRHEEIVRTGIREVVVFHSSVRALLQYEADLPFAVIADPARHLYVEFGVERSPLALLDLRAWRAELRGSMRRRNPLPTNGESITGLPADFLIGRDGQHAALKYGVHANDQWSVDEVLGLAGALRARQLMATTPSIQ
jgi:peroxiredoxin